MAPLRRSIRFCLLLLVLLMCVAGAAQGQPPFYRIGAPYPPLRDPRLTTDNGIPGTGSYYYLDYPWPSLRQALQEYGLFGRRYNKTHAVERGGGYRFAPLPSAATNGLSGR
jgi:hypothetical protein